MNMQSMTERVHRHHNNGTVNTGGCRGKKVRARIAVAGNRCEELEKLICRIYEDNILGKLPDSRYEVLDKQYAREKAELDAEIKELEAKLTEYEKSRNSAGKFIALIDKYEKFEELTPAMVNEFVDKVLVHERDRKEHPNHAGD